MRKKPLGILVSGENDKIIEREGKNHKLKRHKNTWQIRWPWTEAGSKENALWSKTEKNTKK